MKMGGTLKGELMRTAELLVQITEEQGLFFCDCFLE